MLAKIHLAYVGRTVCVDVQAMEYAKKVPKPRVLPRHNSVDNVSCGLTRPTMSDITSDITDFMQDELQRLQARHRAERQQVALLMQNNI